MVGIINWLVSRLQKTKLENSPIILKLFNPQIVPRPQQNPVGDPV